MKKAPAKKKASRRDDFDDDDIEFSVKPTRSRNTKENDVPAKKRKSQFKYESADESMDSASSENMMNLDKKSELSSQSVGFNERRTNIWTETFKEDKSDQTMTSLSSRQPTNMKQPAHSSAAKPSKEMYSFFGSRKSDNSQSSTTQPPKQNKKAMYSFFGSKESSSSQPRKQLSQSKTTSRTSHLDSDDDDEGPYAPTPKTSDNTMMKRSQPANKVSASNHQTMKTNESAWLKPIPKPRRGRTWSRPDEDSDSDDSMARFSHFGTGKSWGEANESTKGRRRR